MPTSLNKYIDRPALDETVVNIRQIEEALEEEMQDLPYARPDGLYPDMTVGAVIGADETAQWVTRESTGSGTATVRSVQGAAVAWGQMVLFSSDTQTSSNGVTFQRKTDGTVTASGTADGGDGYTTLMYEVFAGHKYLTRGCPEGGSPSTYRSYITGVGFPFAGYQDIGHGAILSPANDGSATYVLANIKNGITVDNLVFRPQLFDLTAMFGSGNEPATVAEFEAMFPEAYYPYSAPTLKPVQIAGIASTDAQGGELDSIEWTTQTLRAAGSVADMLYSDHVDVRVGERAYQSGDESDATVRTDGTTTYYPLTNPTTTPISPELPTTYRVQAGGSESIIVPDGEISAAPVLTVAEPVNMSTELARIWAAIESLGYTRNTAQLSRPVSLTDIGSSDEVQKDTAEIETTKEVKE